MTLLEESFNFCLQSKIVSLNLIIDKSPLFYYFLRNSSLKEGTNNIVKLEKTKLGKFEMQLLAYAQLRKKEIISSVKTCDTLNIIMKIIGTNRLEARLYQMGVARRVKCINFLSNSDDFPAKSFRLTLR